jgi:hypothetical protein
MDGVSAESCELWAERHCEEKAQPSTKQSGGLSRDAGDPIASGAPRPRNDAAVSVGATRDVTPAFPFIS